MIGNVAENTRLGENMFPRHSIPSDRAFADKPKGKFYVDISELDEIVDGLSGSHWIGDYYKMRDRRKK